MNKNWKTALAAMGIVPKNGKPNMVLEIQDANGVNLVFPDVNDITEIEVGTAVTAEDGEHVFTADNNTYTIVVAAGVVTELEVEPIEPPAPAPGPIEPTNVLTPETIEMLQAFADQFEASATAIAALQAQNAELVQTIADLKGLMSHADDKKKDEPTSIMIGGKQIDLNKLNLK
jgi:hypothetical protein